MVSTLKLQKSFLVMVSLLILPIAQAADIELSSVCSLADAITAANTDETTGGCRAGDGADTIRLSNDIRLRAELPKVSSAIVVEGEGYRISGATEHRIFFVGPDGELSINNLHLLDGRAGDCRRLDINRNLKVDEDASCGGAILNLGELYISDSSFSDNSADGRGGGIYNYFGGVVNVTNSSYSRNTAKDNGGSIYNFGKMSISTSEFSSNSAGSGGALGNAGDLSITSTNFDSNTSGRVGGVIDNDGDLSLLNSHFISNRANRSGGGIYNKGHVSIVSSYFFGNRAESIDGGAVTNRSGGELHITGSSFIGNEADDGGGAISSEQQSDTEVSNCIINGNQAEYGGGISVEGGLVTLTHLTLARNSAERGGGLFVDDEHISTVRLRNSIVSNNGGSDCEGSIGLSASNVDTDGSCFAILSGDPMLGELVEPDDGSPAYFPLLEGSPAIDAANDEYCPDTDIIGTRRPQGAACDIGAYELPQ